MTQPPAGFRYIDVHTHLHPEWPYDEERAALWARGLPMPVFQKIFHDNAARVLRLGA